MAVEIHKDISSLPQLINLIRSILSKTSRTSKLTHRLSNIVHYQDVMFYTWKMLMKILRSEKSESGDVFMLNVLEMLEKIGGSGSKMKQNEVEGEQILGLQNGSKKFVLDVSMLEKHIQKVWEMLINKGMSHVVHRKLLLVLLEFYLSKLKNPLFLTDFLMASVNIKGVIRILALQGIATLMQKNNIEYPNIYRKLYSMFEPSIFHTKYKSRLFYLANIFLSSTHLPENLVAAFAKRASRLSLACTPPDILIILRFVGNLLLRHTGLIKMIHYPTTAEVAEDPFAMEEEEPSKSRAKESSLWELALLDDHCQPATSSAAKFIHSALPSMEFDLGQVLNGSYQGMFESECNKRKEKTASVTFQRPQETVAKLKDDRVFKLWALTR